MTPGSRLGLSLYLLYVPEGAEKKSHFFTPVLGTGFAGRGLPAGILSRCQLKHPILLEKGDIRVQIMSLMCTICFAVGKGEGKTWFNKWLFCSLLWKCRSWLSECYWLHCSFFWQGNGEWTCCLRCRSCFLLYIFPLWTFFPLTCALIYVKGLRNCIYQSILNTMYCWRTRDCWRMCERLRLMGLWSEWLYGLPWSLWPWVCVTPPRERDGVFILSPCLSDPCKYVVVRNTK